MTTVNDSPATRFDPAQVPVFPVITVEVVDAATLLVDGQERAITVGESATDAAVHAAADAIRRRNLSSARVSAILDGNAYPLVVTADGEKFEVDSRPRRRRRRVWILPVTVMVLAIIAAAVVVVTQQLSRVDVVATDPRPSTPGPTPTELPVLPPNGWSTHATWFAPLRAGSNPTVVTADGTVVAIADDGTIRGFDAVTGATRWSSDLGRAAVLQGPIRTEIDGEPAVAVVTTRQLAWWPTIGAAESSAVELPDRATVSFAGRSPLVLLPDQHAGVIVNGALSDRIIPAGAEAVRADGATVTALDEQGRVWRLSRSTPRVPDPIATMTAPKKGQQPRFIGTAGSVIMLRWHEQQGGTRDQVAVHDLKGKRLSSAAARTAYDSWQSDGRYTATGHGFLVTVGGSPSLTAIRASNWRTTKVIDGQVYGITSGGSATLDRRGAALMATDPTSVSPAGLDSRHAYVIATAGGKPVLYALEPA